MILTITGIVGLLLLAIAGLVDRRRSASGIFKLSFEGITNLGLVLATFFPLGLAQLEEWTFRSFPFWLCLLVAVALLALGLVGCYRVVLDLLQGAVKQSVKVVQVRRLSGTARKKAKAADIYQLRTDEGLSLSIDFAQYQRLEQALAVKKPLPLAIEYFPKTKILRDLKI